MEDIPPAATTSNLHMDDHKAEIELYDILIMETQHLGTHAAGPRRRAASGRVETKLTLLRDQLPQTQP